MLKDTKLIRTTPEEQGIPSKAIIDYLRSINQCKLEMHSFMIVRHGCVIAEGAWKPYLLERKHELFSVSKGFTSTAIGIAIDQGCLCLDDKVTAFFPEYVDEKHAKNLRRMTVRNLLSMSTGHDNEIWPTVRQQEDGNWIKGFFEQTVALNPGEKFVYTNAASYMLSAILNKATGKSLEDFLKENLFEVLQITNPRWDRCPCGIDKGAYGLKLSTEDIAKFGLLYMQEGVWEGKRIVSQKWVESATSCVIESSNEYGNIDNAQGYGYQFWQCRNGAYRAEGIFGQECIVIPEKDMVIVLMAGVNPGREMQLSLDLIWRYILAYTFDYPILTGNEDLSNLLKLESNLEIPLCEGRLTTEKALLVSGVAYSLGENTEGIVSVEFSFGEDETIVKFTGKYGTTKIHCGMNDWVETDGAYDCSPSKVLVRGSWTNDTEFTMIVRYIDTVYSQVFKFMFYNEKILIDSEKNLHYAMKKKMPRIIGRKKK